MYQKNKTGFILHAIVGSILLPILYYYSLKKNSMICALIPTIPLLGLYGLYCINENNGNIQKYLIDIIVFGLFYMLFFILTLLIYNTINNIILATSISLLLWLGITILYTNSFD